MRRFWIEGKGRLWSSPHKGARRLQTIKYNCATRFFRSGAAKGRYTKERWKAPGSPLDHRPFARENSLLRGFLLGQYYQQHGEYNRAFLGALAATVIVAAPLVDDGSKKHVLAASNDASEEKLYGKQVEDLKGLKFRKISDVFYVKEELGQGGYAVVRRGVYKGDNESYALKVLSKQENVEKYVLSEIKIHSQVGYHQNINRIVSWFETNDTWVIVLEHLNGGELFEQLVDRGEYSEWEASETIRKIGTAILHLHTNNIVHGDIKPENIMINNTADGPEPSIVDFGMAFNTSNGVHGELEPHQQQTGKSMVEGSSPGGPGTFNNPDFANDSASNSETYDKNFKAGGGMVQSKHSNSVNLGTIAYAPKEVLCSEEENIGKPIDIWALGILMYILLSGMHPFDPDNESSDDTISERIKANDYSFDDPIWETISPYAIELIKKLLSPNYEDRPTISSALKNPWLADHPERVRLQKNRLGADNIRKYINGRRRIRATALSILLGLNDEQIEGDEILDGASDDQYSNTDYNDQYDSTDYNLTNLIGLDGKKPIPLPKRHSLQPSDSSLVHGNLHGNKSDFKSEKANENTKMDKNEAMPIGKAEQHVTGTISPGHFEQGESKVLRNDGIPDDHVYKRFDILDTKGDGVITVSTIKKVTEAFGEKLDDEEIQEMIDASAKDSETVGGNKSSAPGISTNDIRSVCDSLRSQQFLMDTTISKQGDLERVFYLLVNGIVEQSVITKEGRRIYIDTIKPGEHFGTDELLRTDGVVERRATTFTCTSPDSCTVLTLPQNDLAIITDVFEGIEMRLKEKRTRKIKEMLFTYMQNAMPNVVQEKYAKGDIVVAEGDATDDIFLIVRGEVEVIKTKDDEDQEATRDDEERTAKPNQITPIRLEVLREGDLFPLGVAGIFRSFSEGSITRRGATVRCVTPVKLVRVEGKPFRDFLRNSSSVVYESVQKELLSRLKSRNIKTNVKDDADDLYDTEYDDENDRFEKPN